MTTCKLSLKSSLATTLLALCACGVTQLPDLEITQAHDPIYQEEDWVQIPAGEFLMGSPDSDNEAADIEKPQHKVTLSKAFKIGRHEVTFEDYDRFTAGYKSAFNQ
jgi:formylglycine-generating enzyme required for sulfatase activity